MLNIDVMVSDVMVSDVLSVSLVSQYGIVYPKKVHANMSQVYLLGRGRHHLRIHERCMQK